MRTYFTLLPCTLFLLATSVIGQNQSLPRYIADLLSDHSLQYVVPPGFDLTPVIANGDVKYDFAVKSKTKKLEIRYRIWPLQQADKTDTVDPNALHQAMLMTMSLNISNGEEAGLVLGRTRAHQRNRASRLGNDGESLPAGCCNSSPAFHSRTVFSQTPLALEDQSSLS